MGDKIVTVITTSITIIVLSLILTFVSMERKIDVATSVIQEFTETVQYKGCITLNQYNTIVQRIPYKSFKLQITNIKPVNGTNTEVLDIIFPDTIKNELSDHSIYKFSIGDQVKVDLIVKDESAFDAIAFHLFKRAGSGTKLIASDSGVIYNIKYE